MKFKQELRELRSLYDLLPEADIACVEGCSACCGPVPASRAESRLAPRLAEIATDPIALYEMIHNTADNCGNCPYIKAGNTGCAIYDDRPFLCRLFGLVDGEPEQLKCRYGPRTTKPLTPKQAERLTGRYLKIFMTDPQKVEEILQTKANWLAASEYDGQDYLGVIK